MLLKLVCLNLNRRYTRQQPVPAYKPANLLKKIAAAKMIVYIHNSIISVHFMKFTT